MANRAQIISAIVALVGVVVTVIFFLWPASEDQVSLAKTDRPTVRLAVEPGAECFEAGHLWATWSRPVLTGSAFDDEFNELSDGVIRSSLALHGVSISEDGLEDVFTRPRNACSGTSDTNALELAYVYVKADITWISERLLSIVFRSGGQGGGGHEYGDSEGVIFDLATGRQLNWPDIFRSGDSMAVLAEATCRGLPSCSIGSEELQEYGRLALGPTGLLVLFGDCEVVMCAYDLTESTIEWSGLLPLFRDDFVEALSLGP